MSHNKEQLQVVHERVLRKKAIEKKLKLLNDQRYEIDKKARELDKVRLKEEKDVEKLQGKNLTALYYYIRGMKEGQLEQEQKEAYEAAVEYEMAVEERQAIDKDIAEYEWELSTLNGCEERYEKILKERKEEIIHSRGEGKEKVLEFEEQFAYLDSQRQEVKEAMAAGGRARIMANDVLIFLDEAKGFGIMDLLGGDVSAYAAKRNALEHAQQLALKLKASISKFKIELSQIHIHEEAQMHVDTQIKVEGFLHFADFFLDGLYMDWLVLTKIDRSQKQMVYVIREIDTTLDNLENMLAAIDEKKIELEHELGECIGKGWLDETN